MLVDNTFVVRAAILDGARRDETLIAGRPGTEEYLDGLHRFILRQSTDSVLMEAIAVASPDFARELEAIRDGRRPENAKVRRVALNLAKYVIRATCRPTPFGLFAGVATGGFGERPVARWGDAHTKHVRPDGAWLAPLLREGQQAPETLASLSFVRNSLSYSRGARMVLPYASHPTGALEEGASSAKEITIRDTPAVQAVLAATERPVRYDELRANLADRFPEIPPARLDGLLLKLLDVGFLLSDLQWHQASGDGLAPLIRRLGSHPHAEVLRAAESFIGDFARRSPEEGRRVLLDGRAASSGEAIDLQVDLELDVDVTLPVTVKDEIEDLTATLCRLDSMTVQALSPGLRGYHTAFLERYGQQTLVPLLELLDPHLGLGAPRGYEMPADVKDHHNAPAEPEGPRFPRALALLLEEAIMTGAEEISIDDDVVKDLGGRHHGARLPAYFDLCLTLDCESLRAAQEGDFTLSVSGIGAVPTSGAILGRFARHLRAERVLAGSLRAPLPADEWLTAQLVYSPFQPRHLNVSKVPNVLAHIIPVGVPYESQEPGVDVLPLTDLAVGATDERLYVWSKAHGRRVFAAVPNMLRQDVFAPNAVRLLAEISQGWVTSPFGWNWGHFSTFPYLPRVRYGRTILAKARWRPAATLKDGKLSWPEWCTALEDWRRLYRVPDRVELSDGDNRLDLDLTSGLHLELLRDELRKRPGVELREVAADRPGSWLAGRTTEIVVSVKGQAEKEALSLRRPPRPASGSARHPLGSEWLYLKLYSRAESQDQLLSRSLPLLLDSVAPHVDKWFFIRYVDPEHHVRLRMHGDPGNLLTQVLPRVAGTLERLSDDGEISHWTTGTYHPEVARYGGPDHMPAAEAYFSADSDLVLCQLDLVARGELDLAPEVLAAMNHIQLLTDLGLDWAHWATGTFPAQVSAVRTPPRLRGQLRAVDPRGGWAGLDRLRGGTLLRQSWTLRSQEAKAYSAQDPSAVWADSLGSIAIDLLHMHANRLLGVDREAEGLSYKILQSAARTFLNRKDTK
ncbi:lantibiotic dehydratase [Streptosporangium sp. KLBMP 9127]|nr:lantibiotic dehydratase [Streptosporangium sp. KLBMP 9127]